VETQLRWRRKFCNTTEYLLQFSFVRRRPNIHQETLQLESEIRRQAVWHMHAAEEWHPHIALLVIFGVVTHGKSNQVDSRLGRRYDSCNLSWTQQLSAGQYRALRIVHNTRTELNWPAVHRITRCVLRYVHWLRTRTPASLLDWLQRNWQLLFSEVRRHVFQSGCPDSDWSSRTPMWTAS